MTSPVHTHLSRRDILEITGTAGSAAIGGQVLYTYSSRLDYDDQVSRGSRMFENSSDKEDFIRVELTADINQSGSLFDAIPLRQNTRSGFVRQMVKTPHLDILQSLYLESSVKIQFVTNPAELEEGVEYLKQGNMIQYADKAFVDELIFWLRFNRCEILSSLKGSYSVCSGNSKVLRWLGTLFVSGTDLQQQADMDVYKLRSSSGAVIIISDSDHKTSWVCTGQVYERLALMMTSLNIKSAFLNQPIEVSILRWLHHALCKN